MSVDPVPRSPADNDGKLLVRRDETKVLRCVRREVVVESLAHAFTFRPGDFARCSQNRQIIRATLYVKSRKSTQDLGQV